MADFAELARLHELCGTLRESAAPVSEPPAGGSREGELILLELKGVNRGVHQHIEGAKKTTDKEKTNFDSNSLQLHNLLYEKDHYQRQIAKCQDFRSAHLDIELVSPEEFAATAPPTGETQGDSVGEEGGDEHRLMVRRLDFELQERRRLAAEKAVLDARKAELLGAARAKQSFLRSLPGHLRAMQRSSAPLQRAFTMQVSGAQQQQHDAARSLPAPLYAIFAHLEAYRDTHNPEAAVEIEGQLADADAWYRQQTQGQGTEGGARGGADDDDARSSSPTPADEQAQEEDTEVQHRSKRAKRDESQPTRGADSVGAGGKPERDAAPSPGGAEGAEDAAAAADSEVGKVDLSEADHQAVGEEAAGAFPLAVTLALPVASGGSVTLSFCYARDIGVVLVGGAYTASKDAASAGSGINGAQLLSDLFPADRGTQLPSTGEPWAASRPTRPYRWAQWIAGLAVDRGDPEPAVSCDTDQESAWRAVAGRADAVHAAATRLVGRVQAQLSLREQLLLMSMPQMEPTSGLLPREASLVRWEVAPAQDPDFQYFRATLQCDAGSLCHRCVLTADITIAPDYPLRPPSFALSFERHPVCSPSDCQAPCMRRRMHGL
jgi:hypothetical protein